MRRSLLGLATALIVGSLAWHAAGQSDELAFRAEVETPRVGVDDQFQLTVTISGRSIELQGEIVPPELTGLRVVGGPSVSTQVSFINGAMSQARVYVWLLQATAVGTASVGPVRAVLAGRSRETAPIAVEVMPGRVLAERGPTHSAFDSFPDDDPFAQLFGRRRPSGVGPGRGEAPKVLIEAVPSRTTLFVGEPLLITYDLVTQTVVAGLEVGGAASYPGFWAEDLEQPQQSPRGETIERDGQRFRRFPVLRKLLVPTKAGSLTVPALPFRIVVPQVDQFFGPIPGANNVLSRSSQPLTITSLALPSTPGFSGAVGSFRVSLSADRTSLLIGDAATLRYRIEGTGNLKWMDRAPELRVAGAKVYPPQVKDDLRVSADGVAGSKTWEYVVVPETAGSLVVGPVAFDYFDPTARRLVRREAAPVRLEVVPPAESSVLIGTDREPPSSTSRFAELRLRNELDPARAPSHLAPAALIGAIVAVASVHLSLFAVPWFGRFRRHRFGRQVAPTSSPRAALAALRRAGRGADTKEAIATAIDKALFDVFGEISERPVEESERDKELRAIVEEVRFIRYAPQLGDYSEKIQEVTARAVAAIRRWA